MRETFERFPRHLWPISEPGHEALLIALLLSEKSCNDACGSEGAKTLSNDNNNNIKRNRNINFFWSTLNHYATKGHGNSSICILNPMVWLCFHSHKVKSLVVSFMHLTIFVMLCLMSQFYKEVCLASSLYWVAMQQKVICRLALAC